jgi:putative ABC transport system permease protein
LAGWWIAKWGVQTYQLAMARKSSWLILDYTMDHRVLTYLIGISIATGVLFGLAPALRLSRLDVNTGLRDGGRSATGSARERRLSDFLVAGEMALAIVLLAGAGVMIRSFLKIHSADMGVHTGDLLVGSMQLPRDRYSRPEQMISFYDRLTTRLRPIPGMESVAFAEVLPTYNTRRLPYQLEGAGPPNERRRPRLGVVAVSPEYFQTLGATVLAGRDFFDADVVSDLPLVIVNQALATRFWPGENPVGKRLRLLNDDAPAPWRTVIGVASNIVQNDVTRQRFDPLVYVPLRQRTYGGAWLLMRTGIRPEALKTAVRREVRALDPDLPMYGPLTLTDRLEGYWDSRFYGALFLIFAALALLMASIGLYTVVAHAVRRRTAEIGIRMAVGATARDVFGLVFRQGMLPLAFGLAIGLPASMAVNRILKAALVQVSPGDPITLVVASAVLILSAALGCWIPARRAMRVDPVVALRYE